MHREPLTPLATGDREIVVIASAQDTTPMVLGATNDHYLTRDVHGAVGWIYVSGKPNAPSVPAS